MAVVSGIRSGIRSVIRSGVNPSDGAPDDDVVALGTLLTITPTFYSGTAKVRQNITAASVGSGQDNANATSYTTASVTLASGKPYILFVLNNTGTTTTASQSTVTGASATWVQEETNTFAADGRRRLTAYRTIGAGTSGALNFDMGGVTHVSMAWDLVEITNGDATGTNGSGAIVQAESNSSTTSNVTTLAPSPALSAFENATNINLTAVALSANNAVTPGGGFAELTDAGLATDTIRLETQWKVNDNSCDPSWTTTTAAVIGLEIKSANV